MYSETSTTSLLYFLQVFQVFKTGPKSFPWNLSRFLQSIVSVLQLRKVYIPAGKPYLTELRIKFRFNTCLLCVRGLRL